MGRSWPSRSARQHPAPASLPGKPPVRRPRVLNPALDFEDDGASFRVRQERRQGGRLARRLRQIPSRKLFFWLCAAPPLAAIGLVAGAFAALLILG